MPLNPSPYAAAMRQIENTMRAPRSPLEMLSAGPRTAFDADAYFADGGEVHKGEAYKHMRRPDVHAKPGRIEYHERPAPAWNERARAALRERYGELPSEEQRRYMEQGSMTPAQSMERDREIPTPVYRGGTPVDPLSFSRELTATHQYPAPGGGYVNQEIGDMRRAIEGKRSVTPTPTIADIINRLDTSTPPDRDIESGMTPRRYAEGGPAEPAYMDPMGGMMQTGDSEAPAPGAYERAAQIASNVGAAVGRPLVAAGRGATEIPGTVGRYFADVSAGPDPSQRLAEDLKKFGSMVWQHAKEDPVGTALDIAPVIGEIRSGMDAEKLSREADAAEAAGNLSKASQLRQLAAVATAGAAPLLGTAARLGKRGAKAGVEATEAGVEAGAKGAGKVGEEVAAAAVPEIEKAAIEGAQTAVESAKFAGKAGSTPEQMAALLDDVRGTQIGKMVERYQDLPAEQATQLLYQDLKGLAIEGKIGKEWYERSSKRILDFVGGNADMADKFAQLIAIYSPQTAVDVNTQNAIKAYNRAITGEKIWDGKIVEPDMTFPTIKAANDYIKELGGSKAGFTKIPLDDSGKRFLIAQHGSMKNYENIATLDRDLKAHLVMNEDVAFEGRKINNFYNNLMVQIDPSRLQGSTQDLWMARAFGFLEDAVGSGAKYDFMERLTADLANDLGWKPHQVQAAIWTAMKTRQEGVKDAVRAAAVENGVARMVPDPQAPGKMKFEVEPGKEGQFASMVREASLGAEIGEREIALAARDFSDFLDQNLAYVSWEAVPSTKIGHLDGLGDLPPQARAEYHTEISKALQDEQGRDLLANYLNILSPGSVTAPGYWEGVSNPATLTQVGATRVKAAGQQPNIDAASKGAMELYANALGLLLKQDGVGYHRPYYNPQVTKANGIEYKFERPLSREDIMSMGRMLDENFGGSVALIPVGNREVRVLNFGDAKDQRLFHRKVDEVFGSDSIDNAATSRYFASDGDLVSNNWKEKPNGEDYISRISSAGRPDVLEYVSDFLAPRVQAVDRKFAGQYGLKTNEGLESHLVQLGKKLEGRAEGGPVSYADGGAVGAPAAGAPARSGLTPIAAQVANETAQIARQGGVDRRRLAFLLRMASANTMKPETAFEFAGNILDNDLKRLRQRFFEYPRSSRILSRVNIAMGGETNRQFGTAVNMNKDANPLGPVQRGIRIKGEGFAKGGRVAKSPGDGALRELVSYATKRFGAKNAKNMANRANGVAPKMVFAISQMAKNQMLANPQRFTPAYKQTNIDINRISRKYNLQSSAAINLTPDAESTHAEIDRTLASESSKVSPVFRQALMRLRTMVGGKE